MHEIDNQEDLQAAQAEPADVLFSEADSLFLSELQTDNELRNDVEATKLLWAIKKIKEKEASLKETKKQFMDFFSEKFDQLDNTKEFLETKILNYLDSKGENLTSPAGTAFITERKKVNYPDDDVLLQFSKDNNIEYKVTEKPYKNKVKEFVQGGGEKPEGYEEYLEKSVTIRS